MIKINNPIIVEGKYDKIRLSNIVDAPIFTTEGFGVFNNKDKQMLFKKLSDKEKIIILTDSDNAGKMIRSKISSFLKPDSIINVYLPQIRGKEKRKNKSSAEGYLGVEGIDDEVIEEALKKFCNKKCGKRITTTDLFEHGLTGKSGSCERRKLLLERLMLPQNLKGKSFLDALNAVITYDEFIEITEG